MGIVPIQEMGEDNTTVNQPVSMRVPQLAKVGIVQMEIAITLEMDLVNSIHLVLVKILA